MSQAAPKHPSRELAADRKRAAAEIAALVHLAELDDALLSRTAERRRPVHPDVADERRVLGARLSPDTLEAYERARRGGRHPAVVGLLASVCSGCHVRLHSTLEQRIRRRGLAACPHCLRLVYDPAWLDAAVPQG
ncbi:MAG TPA: hypothetical protein VGB87_12785 [Vicinamibacteria bacterium]